MERETITFSVGKHQIVAKSYATAREHQAIQRTLLRDAKFDISAGAQKVTDFDPTVMFEMQEELVRQLVVSVDGVTEGLVDICFELPSEDFDALVTALDEIVSKKKS